MVQSKEEKINRIWTLITNDTTLGVPLIIEGSLPDYLSNNNEYSDSPDWKLFGDFMSTSRINLNIRQVYPPGEKQQ